MSTALINYVKANKLGNHIKLALGIDKIRDWNDINGNQKRYFRCFIGGADVSQMVAAHTGYRFSKATGCVIVPGSNMDMAFALQNKIYKYACQEGEADMFDSQEYIYLGLKKRGEYPHGKEYFWWLQ